MYIEYTAMYNEAETLHKKMPVFSENNIDNLDSYNELFLSDEG